MDKKYSLVITIVCKKILFLKFHLAFINKSK